MPSLYSREELLVHPKNRALLEEAAGIGKPGSIVDSLSGVPVRFTEGVPERITHTEWDAPPPSAFVEYGPEDEAWMRPLGLGTVRTVDDGPGFYLTAGLNAAFTFYGLPALVQQPRHEITVRSRYDYSPAMCQPCVGIKSGFA